jgi:TRAP-type C4-dicarboxylate transport system permease small subunit
MKMAEKFWSGFDKTVTAMMVMGAALIIIDTLAVSIDVIVRYITGVSYTGLFELTEYSLLWITFLPTAWLLKTGGHIRVDLLADRLEPRPRAILDSIASIIGVIVLGALTWYGAKLTVLDFQTGLYLSSILAPVKWPIEIIIPIGYFLLLVDLLRKTYHHLLALRSPPYGELKKSDASPGGES